MMNDHITTAVQLTPILERVHGNNHPELARVNELTQQIASSTNAREIAEMFGQLREVTKNYAIPGDACEAYQSAYRALQTADQQQSDI